MEVLEYISKKYTEKDFIDGKLIISTKTQEEYYYVKSKLESFMKNQGYSQNSSSERNQFPIHKEKTVIQIQIYSNNRFGICYGNVDSLKDYKAVRKEEIKFK